MKPRNKKRSPWPQCWWCDDDGRVYEEDAERVVGRMVKGYKDGTHYLVVTIDDGRRPPEVERALDEFVGLVRAHGAGFGGALVSYLDPGGLRVVFRLMTYPRRVVTPDHWQRIVDTVFDGPGVRTEYERCGPGDDVSILAAVHEDQQLVTRDFLNTIVSGRGMWTDNDTDRN